MKLRDRTWYPVAYMFVVTAAFSVVLVGFSRVTRERVEANRLLAFERAVLQASSLSVAPDASGPELHALYARSVRDPDAGSAGAYRVIENGSLRGYVLPFEGRGFWDVIKGVIGLAPDRRTITGISFYAQRETPGLGAEIVKPRFRAQFTGGKRMAEEGEPLVFKLENEPTGPTEVNAITGASQTCARLERIVNDRLAEWREAMDKAESPE